MTKFKAYIDGINAAHIENLKDIIRRYEDDEEKLRGEVAKGFNYQMSDLTARDQARLNAEYWQDRCLKAEANYAECQAEREVLTSRIGRAISLIDDVFDEKGIEKIAAEQLWKILKGKDVE